MRDYCQLFSIDNQREMRYNMINELFGKNQNIRSFLARCGRVSPQEKEILDGYLQYLLLKTAFLRGPSLRANQISNFDLSRTMFAQTKRLFRPPFQRWLSTSSGAVKGA